MCNLFYKRAENMSYMSIEFQIGQNNRYEIYLDMDFISLPNM